MESLDPDGLFHYASWKVFRRGSNGGASSEATGIAEVLDIQGWTGMPDLEPAFLLSLLPFTVFSSSAGKYQQEDGHIQLSLLPLLQALLHRKGMISNSFSSAALITSLSECLLIVH